MPEYTQMGPATFLVNAPVTRGQAVMPDGATGKIKPTTGAVTTFLGVARDDAAPEGSGSSTNFGTLRPEVAVFQAPYTVEMTFAADCAFGVKVVAAANGQVTPVGAAAATDATTVIGSCVSPAGATSGNKALVKLV